MLAPHEYFYPAARKRTDFRLQPSVSTTGACGDTTSFRDYNAEEVFVVNIVHDHAARRRC